MIKAELEPLTHRKYYGTTINLFNTLDGRKAYFSIWINNLGDYSPSKRELQLYGQPGENEPRREEVEICDDHYESAFTLQIAEVIVVAINKEEIVT